MTDQLPLPEPAYGFYGAPMFSAEQMHAYSDAENAALRERVKVLGHALTKIVRVLGPTVPPCCAGCNHEWDMALTTARAALEAK